jgi:hypothetical protein
VQIAWPIAIAAGFLVAQITLRADAGYAASLRTFLEPHDAIDWLPHIVLLALGVSIVMYLAPSRRGLLYFLAFALCLAAPVRLLSGNIASHWSPLVKLAWLAVLTAMLGATWLFLAPDDDANSPPFRVPLLVFVAVGIAMVLTQSGVLTYGMSAAALGAAICGAGVACGFRKSACNSGAAASAGVITLVFGSLIILTHFFAELSLLNAALVLVALVATAVPLPDFTRTGAAWRQIAARVVLCTVPIILAAISVIG